MNHPNNKSLVCKIATLPRININHFDFSHRFSRYTRIIRVFLIARLRQSCWFIIRKALPNEQTCISSSNRKIRRPKSSLIGKLLEMHQPSIMFGLHMHIAFHMIKLHHIGCCYSIAYRVILNE